jgi:eukaryotic-like serine/threonine-protein kinase
MQQKVLDGRYELERKVGEGGMARVYIGRDLRLNRRVAIKIPHPHIIADGDFLSRFRHEAQAAAMLTHPNLVDVYDVGQDGDIHYIVMEYVEGTDLKTLINREAPLPIARALAIAEQIARGLHAAHRAGLVHRDVKPQNIIVTPEGFVRITDFGVAKSHLSTALTETGVSFGTVDYISPEQAQGLPAGPQADIYALGVVLYEMLTARLPFSGNNAVAVAMKHVAETPPPPRSFNRQIPPHIEALVLRAMAKDPHQRPRSAEEFARLLSGVSQLSEQETVIGPGGGVRPPLPARPANPTPPVQSGRPANGGTSRTPIIPPPRTAPARAPRQEGVGCGVFLVGMLILGGVLGMIVLFSSGAFSGLFDWVGGSVQRPTSVVPTQSPTEEPELTPTPDIRVAVPSLIGLNDNAAQEQLRQLQINPFVREANNPDVPIRQVISQEVPAGDLLFPGSVVTYTVSLGPVLVTVPSVTNIRANLARQQLEAVGLRVEVIEQPSASVDAGFVISQSPSAGLGETQGATVTIRVSLGDVVRFPNVIGLQRAEAEAILNSTQGLDLVFVDEQGPDRLSGFEGYAPNEVVSAALDNGSGLVNGEFIPRGSRIVLGVRAP